jgi:hypothetical protein
MKQARWVWLVVFAASSVGCVAHIDSSANPKSEADGGNDASVPQKPAPANDDDDAGAPPVVKPDAGKPPVTNDDDDDDEDDAGRPPVVSMPMAGSMSTPMPMPDAGMACDFRGLVQMKCGGSACHGAPASGTGLDLTSPMLAMRVEGRKGPAACSNKLLIDKANPAQSAIYLKITGTTCGSQMPLGGSLTASEKACVLSWIDGLP